MNKEVLEEIKNTFVEGSFASRWTEIETNHKIGELVNSYLGELMYGGVETQARCEEFQANVLKYLKKPESFILKCIAVYMKYPDLNKLKEGKNISWSKLSKDLLPELPEEEKKEKMTIKKLRAIIEECKRQHEIACDVKVTDDFDFMQGQIAEDINLLKIIDGKTEENS